MKLSPTPIAESTVTIRSDGRCELEIRFADGTIWTDVIFGSEADARCVMQRILDQAIADHRQTEGGLGR